VSDERYEEMLENLPGVREGIPFAVYFLFLSLLTVFLALIFKQHTYFYLAIIFFIFTLFTLFFFRDPDRTYELLKGEENFEEVLSPADGTILNISETFEPKYLQCQATRISIFMSIFDVHVNRSPLPGKIEYLHYNPGRFISAFKEKASIENEQISIGVIREHEGDSQKKILFTLIAGLIARRIVLWKRQSDQVKRGERVGMIRFGSRVDLYLPREAKVMVKKGQHVLAGRTVVAQWPNSICP